MPNHRQDLPRHGLEILPLDGTFTPNGGSVVAITNDWNLAAIGDYNGDGRDDILWRHDGGTVANWLASATGSGAFAPNNASVAAAANDWVIQSPDTQWL